MVLECTCFRSVYGVRGGWVLIGSKTILSSLANESPRWLAALACPPFAASSTLYGVLSLARFSRRLTIGHYDVAKDSCRSNRYRY